MKPFSEMSKEELLLWFPVPAEFLHSAETTPFKFLRDNASLPTSASNPYFTDNDKIKLCMTRGRLNPYSVERNEFDSTFRPMRNDTYSRFVHIDLARKGNHAAMTMSHVSSFVDRINSKGEVYKAPVIDVDCFMHIKPPEIGDIRFEIFIDAIELLSQRGFHIKLVTFDQYQSAMPIDLLRDKGFACEVLSIDRMTYWVKYDSNSSPYRVRHISTEKDYSHGYHILQEIIIDNRFNMCYSDRFYEEVKKVEEDSETGLCYTPTGEPDDLLQSVIGSVTNAWHNEKCVEFEDNMEVTPELLDRINREQRIFDSITKKKDQEELDIIRDRIFR